MIDQTRDGQCVVIVGYPKVRGPRLEMERVGGKSAATRTEIRHRNLSTTTQTFTVTEQVKCVSFGKRLEATLHSFRKQGSCVYSAYCFRTVFRCGLSIEPEQRSLSVFLCFSVCCSVVTTVISAKTAEIMYRCATNRVLDGGLFDGINGVTWRIRQIDLCGGGDVVCRYYCCGNLLFLRYYYRHRRICTKSSRCKQQEAAPESPKQRLSSAMFTVVVAAHAKI